LQIAAQFLNAFNHPQYIPGYLNIVQFHDSNVTRVNLIPDQKEFNRPDLVYSSNSRTIQLVGRFQFLVLPEEGDLGLPLFAAR
jgi:hypothetical protein